MIKRIGLKLSILACVVVIAMLTGCGGGNSGRPGTVNSFSTSDIAQRVANQTAIGCDYNANDTACDIGDIVKVVLCNVGDITGDSSYDLNQNSANCDIGDIIKVVNCNNQDISCPVQASLIASSAIYFPHNQGDTWNYSSSIDGNLTMTIHGTETIQGNNAVVEVYYYKDTGELHLDYSSITSEGAFGNASGLDSSGQSMEIYSPPIKLAPTTFKIGDSWTTTGQVITGEESSAFSSTVKAVTIEDVTVTAGTFRDCIKLQFDDDMQWWLAEGVGMVKEVRYEDWRSATNTTTLVSANIQGTTYPTRATFDIADYFPLNTGDTWTRVHSGYTEKQIITGTESISGVTTSKRERYIDSSLEETEYFAIDSIGLKQYAEKHGETLTTITPELLFAGKTIAVGDSWVSYTLWGENSMVFITKIESTENVTVTAGTFQNTIKLSQIVIENTVTENGVTWLAEDIGPVKGSWTPAGESEDEWTLESATVGGQTYGAPTYNIIDYMPLSVGDKWVYKNISEEYETKEVKATTQIEGITAYQIYEGPTYLDSHFSAITSKGYQNLMDYWSGSDGDYMYYYENDVIGVTIFPAQMELAQTYHYTHTGIIYDQNDVQMGTAAGSADIELLGIETVTVEAGTYSNVLKISMDWNEDYAATKNCTESFTDIHWLAYGIGIVKTSGQYSDVCDGVVDSEGPHGRELVSTIVNGVSYP